MILAIDTSAGQCAAALLDAGGAVLSYRAESMQRGHAEALFPLLDQLFDDAGAEYSGVTGIAVCTGPGSFTGIRVGVAAARGLALGLGLVARGIDRFYALALDADGEGHFAIALKGPRGTAYFQALHSGARQAEAEPIHVPLEDLDALTPAGATRLGDGWPMADEAAGLADPRVIGAAFVRRPEFFGEARPFYLRDAGAAPPREVPPLLLDA